MKAPVSLVRGDGHLGAPGRNPDGAPPRPLREALRELGYVEGKNIVYEAALPRACSSGCRSWPGSLSDSTWTSSWRREAKRRRRHGEPRRYIDRMLKGAKPADLPAVQPTRYYLAVNRKTATTLGLTIPPTLPLRVDQLVE